MNWIKKILSVEQNRSSSLENVKDCSCDSGLQFIKCDLVTGARSRNQNCYSCRILTFFRRYFDSSVYISFPSSLLAVFDLYLKTIKEA